jgi:hypothetical protein
VRVWSPRSVRGCDALEQILPKEIFAIFVVVVLAFVVHILDSIALVHALFRVRERRRR